LVSQVVPAYRARVNHFDADCAECGGRGQGHAAGQVPLRCPPLRTPEDPKSTPPIIKHGT
jgi:hypothetical protein